MSPQYEPGVHRVPEQKCFECGAKLNAMAGPEGDDEAPPQDGSPVTVCLRCGAIYGLTPELRIRELTMRERAELAGDHDMMRQFRAVNRRAHFARRTQGVMVN